MRRQFLGELERLQAKIKEKEEVINQLQQENIDSDQLRSTIRTLEDKLCEKENHIAKLKNELKGNDVKVAKVKTDVSDEVVSDDNEGDGYRVDLDFIKILVDVETDTRALVEKEKTKMPEAEMSEEEEKKRTTTKMFDSESLDLEDTIASNLPDLDEQGLEAELVGSTISLSHNKKQETLAKTRAMGESIMRDEKKQQGSFQIPLEEIGLERVCNQCQELSRMLKEVEEKDWAGEVERLRSRNEELMKRYQAEKNNVGVNTEEEAKDEDDKNDFDDLDRKDLRGMEDDDKVHGIFEARDEEGGRDEKQEGNDDKEEQGKDGKVDKKEDKEQTREEKESYEEGEYNWSQDIIKMISDIEDDVKREIDRNTKKDTTNTSSADLREKDRDYDLREETLKVGYNNDKDKGCCSNDESREIIKDDVQMGSGQDITAEIVETVDDQDEFEMDYTHVDEEKEKAVLEDIGNKEFIKDINVRPEEKEKEIIEENCTNQILNTGVGGKEKDGFKEEEEEKKENDTNWENVEAEKETCSHADDNEARYDWNNDIIKMISDVEDEVRKSNDREHEERRQKKRNTLEEEIINESNEENKERINPEGYNWTNDIVKMMSDIEDDVSRRFNKVKYDTAEKSFEDKRDEMDNKLGCMKNENQNGGEGEDIFETSALDEEREKNQSQDEAEEEKRKGCIEDHHQAKDGQHEGKEDEKAKKQEVKERKNELVVLVDQGEVDGGRDRTMEEADQVVREEEGVEKVEKMEVRKNLTAGLSTEKKLDKKMDEPVVAISRKQELDDESDQNVGEDSGAGSSQEIKVDEEEEHRGALLSSYSGEEESLEGRGESSVLIPCETVSNN